MNTLPEKTVERLILYKRTLMTLAGEKEYIFSHELAQMLHLTPVQIRRDIMLIGYTGTLRKGYHVVDLLNYINKVLDATIHSNVCVMGMGNLGRAITGYFKDRSSGLKIVAAFDNDPDKINTNISGIPCYDISRLFEVVRNQQIAIAVITTPPEAAAAVCEQLIAAGIKGILNFTPTKLKVPDYVYLDEYDMLTSLEKIAFYIRS